MIVLQFILLIAIGIVSFIPIEWVIPSQKNTNPKKIVRGRLILIGVFALMIAANYLIDRSISNSKEKAAKEAKEFVFEANYLQKKISRKISSIYSEYIEIENHSIELQSIEHSIESNIESIEFNESNIEDYKEIHKDYDKTQWTNTTFKELGEEGKENALATIEEFKTENKGHKNKIINLEQSKKNLETKIDSSKKAIVTNRSFESLTSDIQDLFEKLNSDQTESVLKKLRIWRAMLDDEKNKPYDKVVIDEMSSILNLISDETQKGILKYDD